MKKFSRFFALFTVIYLAVWYTLSSTEAGTRALHFGMQENNAFLTRVFLVLGANPKKTDQEGMSALHYAGYLGADQVIPALIKKGALVNLRDKRGRTPLHHAVYNGRARAVAILLDHQADPDIKENVNEMTALHLAVMQKQTAIVQQLLEKGANPNLEEKGSYTPLFIAEQEGLEDIVALLEKYDAR